jgi:hypothetical protein
MSAMDWIDKNLAHGWDEAARQQQGCVRSDDDTWPIPAHRYQADIKAAECDARTPERGLRSPHACAA